MKTLRVFGKMCAAVGVIGAAASTLSCTPTSFLNLTAATSTLVGPLGQATPRRLDFAFINNTPFRAIFTFGGYDPLDKDTDPSGFGQLRLEGNSNSAQLVQACRKTFSVGGEELIRLIETSDLAVNDPRALVDGVNFSGAPLGDPLEAVATEGTAEGVTLAAGVDFACETLIVFSFEQDATAPGGFRIDFVVVPQ